MAPTSSSASTPDPTPWIPRIARKTLKELERLTGTRPTVEQTQELVRLRLDSDRVRLTVDYRVDAVSGRGKWAASTLTVDGRDCPLAHDAGQVARIFQDPDMYAPSPVLFPMPPAREVTEAPAVIQHFHGGLRARLPATGWQLRLGHDPDQNRWVVGLDHNQNGMRVFLAPTSHGWDLDPYRELQVVRDGVDLSKQAEGNLARAVALLTDTAIRTAPAAGKSAATAAAPTASTPNSVTVRRATVIRV